MTNREDDRGRPGEKPATKRKGPIVNRRGPSEVSRALEKMGQNGKGRTPERPGRKPAGPSVSRGTVVRIDRTKGYGFLVDSAGEQRFFHRTAVLDGKFEALAEQQSVDFEPYTDERGARAQKVRPAGAASRDGGQTAKPAKASPRAPKAPAWKSDLSPFRNGSGAPAPGKRRSKI